MKMDEINPGYYSGEVLTHHDIYTELTANAMSDNRSIDKLIDSSVDSLDYMDGIKTLPRLRKLLKDATALSAKAEYFSKLVKELGHAIEVKIRKELSKPGE